jgi:hypothetical protein
MFNESKHDVEFLVISQPPSHGDRVRFCQRISEDE